MGGSWNKRLSSWGLRSLKDKMEMQVLPTKCHAFENRPYLTKISIYIPIQSHPSGFLTCFRCVFLFEALLRPCWTKPTGRIGTPDQCHGPSAEVFPGGGANRMGPSAFPSPLLHLLKDFLDGEPMVWWCWGGAGWGVTRWGVSRRAPAGGGFTKPLLPQALTWLSCGEAAARITADYDLLKHAMVSAQAGWLTINNFYHINHCSWCPWSIHTLYGSTYPLSRWLETLFYLE